ITTRRRHPIAICLWDASCQRTLCGSLENTTTQKMGHKVVCLDCKKSFSQGTDFNDRKEANCPDCGKQMALLPHRFRPPKKSEEKKWETVKFLIDNGFYYQHIYETVTKTINGFTKYENLVPYPDNIRDAKEFVERYKNQARK
ncbi:hypothetical protein, partial [Pontibacter qinzhouensis]